MTIENKIQFIVSDLKQAQLRAEIPKEKEKINWRRIIIKIIGIILLPFIIVTIWLMECYFKIRFYIKSKINKKK
jgi:heme/copper-type cytochrome/quinol oxidase subunit 2